MPEEQSPSAVDPPLLTFEKGDADPSAWIAFDEGPDAELKLRRVPLQAAILHTLVLISHSLERLAEQTEQTREALDVLVELGKEIVDLREKASAT